MGSRIVGSVGARWTPSLPFTLAVHVALAWGFSLLFTLARRRGDYLVQNTFANETYYTQLNPADFNFFNRVISFLFEYGGLTPPIFYALNILCGALLLVLFHAFVTRMLNPVWAAWLTLALALSPEFVYYHNFVLKETFTVVLTTTAIMTLAVGVVERRWELVVLAGILGGMAAVNREFLVLFIIAIPFLVLRGWKAWGVALILVAFGVGMVGLGLYQMALEGARLRAEQVLWGVWGNQRVIREQVLGMPAPVPYITLLQDRPLLLSYLFHSARLYVTPGMAGGNLLNAAVVPAQVMAILFWIYTAHLARRLPPTERGLWRYLVVGTVGCSVALILLDSGERYRYTLVHGPLLISTIVALRARDGGRDRVPRPRELSHLSVGHVVHWIRARPAPALGLLLSPSLLACGVALTTGPRFEARVELAPAVSSLDPSWLVPALGGAWGEPSGAMVREVLQSRPFLERVMDRPVAGRAGVRLGDGYPSMFPGSDYDYDLLRSDLHIALESVSGVLSVAYSHADPLAARAGLGHLLEDLGESLADLRRGTAQAEWEWIAVREEEVRGRLAALETELTTLLRANHAILPYSPLSVEVARLEFYRTVYLDRLEWWTVRRAGLEGHFESVPSPFIEIGDLYLTDDLTPPSNRLRFLLALLLGLGFIMLGAQGQAIRAGWRTIRQRNAGGLSGPGDPPSAG